MTAGRRPTSQEKKWLNAVREDGCIVCHNEFTVYSPGVPHHMDGKTKPDVHFLSFNLCFNHHQEGSDRPEFVSRHPYKAEFESRYGSEAYLLKLTCGRLLNIYNPYQDNI